MAIVPDMYHSDRNPRRKWSRKERIAARNPSWHVVTSITIHTKCEPQENNFQHLVSTRVRGAFFIWPRAIAPRGILLFDPGKYQRGTYPKINTSKYSIRYELSRSLGFPGLFKYWLLLQYRCAAGGGGCSTTAETANKTGARWEMFGRRRRPPIDVGIGRAPSRKYA